MNRGQSEIDAIYERINRLGIIKRVINEKMDLLEKDKDDIRIELKSLYSELTKRQHELMVEMAQVK